MLIRNDDNLVSRIQHLLLATVREAEAEITVPVHGGYGEHGYIDGSDALFIIGTAVAEEHGFMVCHTLVEISSV